MIGEPIEIMLHVDAGTESDDQDVTDLTRRLADDIRELDVDSVKPLRTGIGPEGSKAIEPFSFGALVVTLASSSALTALIKTINSWIVRQKRGSVTIKIGDEELTLTPTADEQRQIVANWLDRHSETTLR